MLARSNVAHLACSHENQPYIVPVHVDLDHEFLYGFATQGQKIDWMRHNPLVCLEMDEFSPGQWASVVVFGRYEELLHQPEYQDSRRLALNSLRDIPCGGSLPPFRLPDIHSGLPLRSASGSSD